MMPDVLKLAFVGCGAIASYHLNGIREKCGNVRVTAAVDPDAAKAERLAADTGAEAFTSLEAALAVGDFDAVDIMVPHDLHEPLAIEALRAGKHLLLEKPMATTLDACDRILATAKEAGTVFMVAENAQYWPEVVLAQEVLDSGEIGEVTTARASFVAQMDSQWYSGAQPWRYDQKRRGGGVVIDGGSHWIRPLRMWLGEIDSVVAVSGRPWKTVEAETLVRALCRFESGLCASFDALEITGAMAPEQWWKVSGTEGELVIDGVFNGGLRVYSPSSPDGRLVAEPQGWGKSFGPEIADFASAVLHGKPLEAGPEDSLAELRTALAMYRSAESGQWEKVWD